MISQGRAGKNQADSHGNSREREFPSLSGRGVGGKKEGMFLEIKKVCVSLGEINEVKQCQKN